MPPTECGGDRNPQPLGGVGHAESLHYARGVLYMFLSHAKAFQRRARQCVEGFGAGLALEALPSVPDFRLGEVLAVAVWTRLDGRFRFAESQRALHILFAATQSLLGFDALGRRQRAYVCYEHL